MTSMGHGRSETAAAGIRRRPPQGWALGDCVECLARFAPRHPRQLFCSEAHRTAWNDRWRVRGRNVGPFSMAERATRGGSRGDVVTGRRARADAAFLFQAFADEDRAAGRMPIVDVLRLRYRLGYERP